MEAAEEQTGEKTDLIESTPRVYLGQTLSLASMIPVIRQLRAALETQPELIEIDSRDLQHLSHGASMLLAATIDGVERSGVRLAVLAAA